MRCVSWILRNITDPEALDTTIRLAGKIRWFDDGANVGLPYDLIVSTFEACFDSTGNVYPALRDRAYYSRRAMVWIHTLAMCKSEEFASTFPLPITRYTVPGFDPDLGHLLQINTARSPDISSLLYNYPECTPSHFQWVSGVLLHLSWANRTRLDSVVTPDQPSGVQVFPLNAMLTC